LAVPAIASIHFLARKRSRSDQRHVAAEDIPELRQLIQAAAAKKLPEPRDPRISAQFECRAVLFAERAERCLLFFGVGDHGAELEHDEDTAALANAPLPKEDWTA